jgi:hypothetical protein
LLACSNQNQSGDGGTDAKVDDVTADAPQDSGTDSGPLGCNTVSNIGTVIQQMYVATDPVTGAGGVIAAGTYALTAAAVYTGAGGGSGPTGTTFADTVVFESGNMYERVASIIDDAGLDGSPIRQNGSYLLDGSSIQVTQTCPKGFQPFTSYDSDAMKVQVYAPPGGPGKPALMFEYTKQ